MALVSARPCLAVVGRTIEYGNGSTSNTDTDYIDAVVSDLAGQGDTNAKPF